MKLTSSVFLHNGKIPRLYTCQGKNINPPLEIAEVPQGAKSLALIMEDPDVPPHVRQDRMYNHWVIFNIDPTTKILPEQAKKLGREGINTSGSLGYVGPCPPDKEHRYFFKLYALDDKLSLKERATKEELLEAMEGHILAQCELMGRYEKS